MAASLFQSPLHRGVLFNLTRFLDPPNGCSDFSPLFIGESSLTDWPLPSTISTVDDFSPLFIGESSLTALGRKDLA